MSLCLKVSLILPRTEARLTSRSPPEETAKKRRSSARFANSQHVSQICGKIRLACPVLELWCGGLLFDRHHAGITPDSATGDYSDVVVKSPYGEIPWPRLSRLSDDEMRTLMIDCVNKTHQFLRTLFDEEAGSEVILRLAARDMVPRWNDPE
jgi:hypothetical protein